MSSLSTSSTPPAGDDSTPESQLAVAAAATPEPLPTADDAAAAADVAVAADVVVAADVPAVADGASVADVTVAADVAPVADVATVADVPASPASEDCGPQLKQLYPALFCAPPKPLKLRIQADIQARSPGLFTKPQLSAFLRRYTGSHAYLNAIVKATHRYDLDGAPGDELSAEHRQAAIDELARRRENTQARRALEDEQRFNRATLLREFGVTTLAPVEFAASKGVPEAELEPLLARARKEALEPPPAPHRDRRNAPARQARGEGGERGERGQAHPGRPARNDRPPRQAGAGVAPAVAAATSSDAPRAPQAGRPESRIPSHTEPRPDAPRGPHNDATPGPRPANANGHRADGPRTPRPEGPRNDAARGPRPDGARGPRPDNTRGPRADGPRGPDTRTGPMGGRGPRNDRGDRNDAPRGPRPDGPRPQRPEVIANPVVPTAMAAAFAALRTVKAPASEAVTPPVSDVSRK